MITVVTKPNTNSQSHQLKIDMTPLVDLGFLLISFFIFTAALSEPNVTRLIMPKEGEQTPVPQRHSLTLLLDGKRLFAYEGLWEEAQTEQRISEASYDLQKGAGNIIRQKQQRSGKDLVVLIKPLATSSYENVVAMLDEMQINTVKKFALVEATAGERDWVESHQP
jgi:biopolymer transport protein ExbD